MEKEFLVDSYSKPQYQKVWSTAAKWVRARQITPLIAQELGSIIHALQSSKILKSDVSRKGTQLKLLLTLEGSQYALFKPKRYSRDYIADDIYAGADRHNGEIIGILLLILCSLISFSLCSILFVKNFKHEICPYCCFSESKCSY